MSKWALLLGCLIRRIDVKCGLDIKPISATVGDKVNLKNKSRLTFIMISTSFWRILYHFAPSRARIKGLFLRLGAFFLPSFHILSSFTVPDNQRSRPPKSHSGADDKPRATLDSGSMGLVTRDRALAARHRVAVVLRGIVPQRNHIMSQNLLPVNPRVWYNIGHVRD